MTDVQWKGPDGGELEVMLSAEKIAERVKEMGAEISARYEGEEIVVVVILKGSFLFAADLIRQITVPVSVEFLAMRSYEGTESTGAVEITSDLKAPIDGKNVVVVEDIVDTGLSMRYLMENFTARHPAKLELASLLHKPARTVEDVKIDYLGFTIEDHFVIGYGLDLDQKYRNLPFIGVFHPNA